MTIAALRHIRKIVHESSGEIPYGAGRQPAVLRMFSQRLSRGFNIAVSGLPDDGWSLLSSDGAEDITISVNAFPTSLLDPMSIPLCSFLLSGVASCVQRPDDKSCY